MKPEGREEQVRRGDMVKNSSLPICAGARKKGVARKRTEEEEKEGKVPKTSLGFCPSDLGDVSLGDSPPGLGGSSSRSYEKRWKGA